ncbi:MAG: transcription elongation factor GreB [Gallionella sp.]|jgi:transcription elongation factor GreB|nr:transcription elongation factor GreB [Gallionella sp.]
MSKAFTRENDGDDDDDFEGAPKLPEGLKNYLTPGGFRQLQEEYKHLWDVERPALVQTVSWAASNGDRSENGDYIYGKKRLREIDRRLRFLAKRLENAQVVDPEQRGECEQVFFGATVTVLHGDGQSRTYSIVGIDEANVTRGHISWVSPLARALLKAREGDVLNLALPGGREEIEVLEVRYLALEFVEDDACGR